MGPMADGCIHLSDAARPLGLDVPVPLDDWRIVLDFLATKRARRGFVPAGRLTGLTLRATDQEWRSGDGPEVTGPSEAMAMAMAGRPAALADLDGDGGALLRTRLRPDVQLGWFARRGVRTRAHSRPARGADSR
jgi:hypothetical protein